MSGLIGYRSGNRGRCVGSCRKPYELINATTGESYGTSYILSMKDLSTIDNIDKLKIADSLKIEGRMKEPSYVANIIHSYRDAIDGKLTKEDKDNLYKTFQRTFTKGYIFHEDRKDIVNIDRPNNFGFYIGYISKKINGYYEITLDKEVNQGDIIRIDHNNEDINLSLQKIYNDSFNLISSANKKVYIQIKENLSIRDKVYKTKDILFTEEINKTYPREFRRFKLDVSVFGKPGSNLTIICKQDRNKISYTTDYVLEESLTRPVDKDSFYKQFAKLNDTVYILNSLDFNLDNEQTDNERLIRTAWQSLSQYSDSIYLNKGIPVYVVK